MSKVQTRAGAAAAAGLAYFLRRLSLDLVGIARAAKGEGTAAEEKFSKYCSEHVEAAKMAKWSLVSG